MATFSIWSLDDNSNVEQIIKQLLKDDGWLFEDDYGIKLEHFFTSRGQLEEALKANDILSYPLLVLLDANLDGDPSDTYGGFYAWRAIMDAITGLATEDKPVVIIYTRDQTVLQLAKPMSGEPANPIILPFAERSTVTIGDFRYGVSPFLEAALERRRSKLLKIASYKERRRAADELADRDPRPKNIKICEWDIASLFPRETKAILQNDTVKQRYIQLIVNTIMCNVCSFGDALKGFLLFFLEQKPGRDLLPEEFTEIHNIVQNDANVQVSTFLHDERITDHKPSHWVTNNRIDITEGSACLAKQLILEANIKWGEILNSTVNHRASDPFNQSTTWSLFNKCIQTNHNKPCYLDHFKNFIKHCYKTFHTDIDNIVQLDNVTSGDDKSFNTNYAIKVILNSKGGRESFTCSWYLAMLGILPSDISALVSNWMSVCNQEFTGFPKPSSLEGRLTAKVGSHWFCGSWCNGVSLLCDIGEPPTNWSITTNAKRKINDHPVRAGSLSELADIVCRIYQGQLIIFKYTGGKIDSPIIKSPYGSADYLSLANILQELLDVWKAHLKSEHVYNLISFRER